MDLATIPPHLEDSEILRLIDGEDAAGELAGLRDHVGGCATCAKRVETIRADAERVRVALAAVWLPTDFPTAEQLMWRAQRLRGGSSARPTPPRSAHGWLRAAAVLLILLLPLALVRPIRAAVLEWVQRGWAAITEAESTTPVTAPATDGSAIAGGSFRVFFTPADEVVELAIGSRQTGGELRVQTTDGPEGSLEIIGGAGETALLAGGGLSIRNTQESTAIYVLRVPAGVRMVRVRIADEPVVLVDRDDVEGGRRIDVVP
jgi:anti-sigma factor RsiW